MNLAPQLPLAQTLRGYGFESYRNSRLMQRSVRGLLISRSTRVTNKNRDETKISRMTTGEIDADFRCDTDCKKVRDSAVSRGQSQRSTFELNADLASFEHRLIRLRR